MKLGKLVKVKDLRSVWKNEAYDFTTWLAKERNLSILSDEIGIEMELIDTEVPTGSFNADILAIESGTDNKIVIENQLEKTDHTHLGQIITYASGHDAKTIIWIVKSVREEHRQAIDWLNDHTDSEINIFLCKIELWKIDNSNVAPKFQIVSSPNNWSKTVKRSPDNKFSATQMLQYNYWERLSEEIDENYPNLKSHKSYPQNYYNLYLEKNIAHISLLVNTVKKHLTTQLWISDSKDFFDFLFEQKDEIENEMGLKLEWERLDNKKASHIDVFQKFDIKKNDDWDVAIKWHLDMASKFQDVFNDKLMEF
ncbi:MAG: DUF4268 domain-containing protein [Methanobrevibacter sp.]|uniref:DUF4268 domain-containing protein n=1 Tax=Methanobrevibacter sp. TaxID=66852 RepID=UPI0025EB36E6|nr:DUF4268 domain-containing protein [Methanobrevibacter sp.]MBR6993921.1 DUF4268 domain-containing protein [Methanobrevibacter sp.]